MNPIMKMTQHRIQNPRIRYLTLILLAFSFAGNAIEAQTHPIGRASLYPLHPTAPNSRAGWVILDYSAYDAGYSVVDVQPAWVGYRLTRSHVGGGVERTNKFQRESRLAGKDASDEDFKGSGLDKGHLVPAADMAWSSQSMFESFSYANVSPQQPGFNRGIWKRLESQVRDWAATLEVDDTLGLFVWSGPVLSRKYPLSTYGRLRIADAFYKVVYHPREARVAALLLPHASSKSSLASYLVSVDSLEKITGMDFLGGLPDQIEESLEKSRCETCWAWSTKASSSSLQSGRKQTGSSISMTCAGTTKEGKPCRNKTRDASGYCHHHR